LAGSDYGAHPLWVRALIFDFPTVSSPEIALILMGQKLRYFGHDARHT
jgi:hypothetical protein